mmetsp:Transcript_51215/g.100590  ORF Transcript_51215/g.100590 Transcript_51215/m.100590 type:complete len:356 (+) Transcript_51215:249-1316(+)
MESPKPGRVGGSCEISSKKIFRRSPRHHWLSSSGSGVKSLERGGKRALVVELHQCGLISASITVVRSRKDRDNVLIMTPIVSIHDKLVCSCDEFQSVPVVELLRNVLPECVPSASGGYAPPLPVVWVRPKKVTHRSFVRNLLKPVEGPDGIDGVHRWGEPAVVTEDLTLDDRSQRKKVETISEVMPHVRAPVLPHALVVESVHLRDLTALVISPQNRYSIWVEDLESKNQRDCLDGVVPSVDVVAKKEVIRVWGFPSYLQQFQEIIKLSVDVACHSYGGPHGLHVLLSFQRFLQHLAQVSDLSLLQRFALQKLVYKFFEGPRRSHQSRRRGRRRGRKAPRLPHSISCRHAPRMHR